MDVVVSCQPSPSHSILTLTPGRTRNIDQDMEALRLSRQDNPFLQVWGEESPRFIYITFFYITLSHSFRIEKLYTNYINKYTLRDYKINYRIIQVLASRESLVESIEESESDDAILMSQVKNKILKEKRRNSI